VYIPQDRVDAPLYVITSVFNPFRYKSRYKLYRDFQARIRAAGAVLITVEAAYGERNFALEAHAPADAVPPVGVAPVPAPSWNSMPSSREHQEYIKVRAHDDVWLKENLINIGIQHVPEDARYIAWIDADTAFVRPDWVSETKHLLQRYDVIQMWSKAVDLSPDYEILEEHMSFMACWFAGMKYGVGRGAYDPPYVDPPYYGGPESASGVRAPIPWHPGFAWAARRSAIDTMGGLMDFAVMGSSDSHMAYALIGNVDHSCHGGVTEHYKRALHEWQARAIKLKANVGAMGGTLLHHWHGKKSQRRYKERWAILLENDFNPYTDLQKDWRGVLHLTGNKPGLRDAMRRYFRERNEDSIDL
jgi:hypothetical protein